MEEGKRVIIDGYLPLRYVLAALGSIAMMIIYGLKVNLSVAIVGMVNHTALEALETSSSGINGSVETTMSPQSSDCGGGDGGHSTDAEDGPFMWSGTLQGTILSAYFWGYLVTQLPGGRIAEMFSAKYVMLFAVAINVVCTLLTPVMAKLHYGAMIAMRVGEGLGGGVSFPAMHVLLAHWAPLNERSVMSSIVYAGTALGTVISMLLSGVIAGKLGWEAIFYIQGGLSAIWIIGWVLLTADTPEKLKFITEKERELITSSLNQGGGGDHEKKLSMPWKSALLSPAFLAILVAHTCSNWGWYMVLIELPYYMKTALNFKISENAVLTAVPFLSMWIFSMVLSKILDTLRAKQKITTTTARKTATLIASVIPLMCFVGLSFIGCLRVLAVVLMTVAVTAVGGMFSGFLSNHIDIAPNFAGTLMAITNTIATIPGIVVPVFVGKLTEKDSSIKSWRIIFFVTIGLYIVEAVVFTIFGSGEVQNWNNPPQSESYESQPLKSPSSPNSGKPHYDSTETSTLEAK